MKENEVHEAAQTALRIKNDMYSIGTEVQAVLVAPIASLDEITAPSFNPRSIEDKTAPQLFGNNAELIRLAQAGDSFAINQFLEENDGLVYFVASKYLNRGLDMESIWQEGRFAMYNALRQFVPSLGFQFSSLAVHWMINAMSQEARRQFKPIAFEFSFSDIRSNTQMTYEQSSSLMASRQNEDYILANGSSDYIPTILSPRQREVFESKTGLKDGKYYSDEEIAEKLGIHKRYIPRYMNDATSKIRRFHEYMSLLEQNSENVPYEEKVKQVTQYLSKTKKNKEELHIFRDPLLHQ